MTFVSNVNQNIPEICDCDGIFTDNGKEGQLQNIQEVLSSQQKEKKNKNKNK